MPPSAEITAVKVPFGTIRSALVKPVTASEKVMVTVAVSPAFKAESFSTIVAVGRWVSITKLAEPVVPSPVLPAKSVYPVLLRSIVLVADSTLASGV